MTLQQLRYFKEVAKTLNFTRAAENLFVAQPSLSHAISLLEKELNAPLFIREKYKKAVLTNYGKVFLPHVEKIFDELEHGKAAVEHLLNPDSGEVNIVYIFYNGHYIVQEIMNEFYSNAVGKNISISAKVSYGTKPIIEQVSEGKADLAISCFIYTEPSIDYQKIADQELFCILNSRHPLASKKRIRLEDLVNENVMRLNTSMNMYDWVTKMFEISGILPNFVDSYSDWSMLMQNVANNKGVTIFPHIAFNSDQLKAIPLDHPLNKRDVYLIWPTNRKLTGAVKYVRDFCLDYFCSKLPKK